ncbi:MAG: 4Fe-4S binding protein [Candidatus Hydrogenedentes bacterium]|nr:4Fe-4S binding protein [Candidatus Hydrogenedentota bacterium]
MRVFDAVKGLLQGMRLTLGYLLSPSKIVTQQYPENRATLKFPERYRAILKFKYDENGLHKCTGCKNCEVACPNASIKVITRDSVITEDHELDRYIWRLDSCMFCNACVQACPFDAIEMGHAFENAVYDRRLLIYGLNPIAGPAASALENEEDPEVRRRMSDPRTILGGPIPLNGAGLPNLKPVAAAPFVDPLPIAVTDPLPPEDGEGEEVS